MNLGGNTVLPAYTLVNCHLKEGRRTYIVKTYDDYRVLIFPRQVGM
jgi:hypothetical protein